MSDNKKVSTKRIIIIIAIVVAALAIIGVILFFVFRNKSEEEVVLPEIKKNTCPIDFKQYTDINPEVYAYVEVPDCNISYPILQHEGDDSYYADHQIDGKQGLPGVIYTENENSKDFSDYLTVVYGHNMKNGSMFHNLHMFEDEAFFNQDHEFYIYTPEHKYTYKIFSSACIGDDHLLYKYKYKLPQGAMDFAIDLQKVNNKYSHYKNNVSLEGDVKLCTLFTCMPNGMDNNRYVVVGYLSNVEDYEV